MKKRILLIILLTLVGLLIIYLLTAQKVEVWTYDLPNNYAIKKTSNTKVVLGKYVDNLFDVYENDEKIGITDYIAEFSYGERYIALKCLEETDDGVVVKFYIIDTNLSDIYGPYENEETYNAVVEKIVDEELSDWIKTTSMPDGAVNK